MRTKQQIETENNRIPSLRISTSSVCNHSCSFCQKDGDFSSQFAKVKKDDTDFLCKETDLFFGLGVRHFSLTGGEPLVNPDTTFKVAKHIRRLLMDLPTNERAFAYLRINTNGTLMLPHIEALSRLFDLVKISLHSLRPNLYASITGSRTPKRDMANVLKAITACDKNNVNIRIQSVITRENIDEVPDIIAYCENHPSIRELKLFDLSEYSELCRPEGKTSDLWNTQYVSLGDIERSLQMKYLFKGTARSIGGYGNPMPLYKTPSNLHIRLRRSEDDAFYSAACPTCSAYKICSDGHCNLEIGSNQLIKVCRPKEGGVFYPGQEKEAIQHFFSTSKVPHRKYIARHDVMPS